MDSLSPSEVLQHLLGEHAIVHTHWVAHHPKIRLPQYVIDAAQENNTVMLELGYNLPVPIRDWTFGEVSLVCTCAFNRVLFTCVLPWDALLMVAPADASVQLVYPWVLQRLTIAAGERGLQRVDKLLADTANTKPNHLKVVK